MAPSEGTHYADHHALRSRSRPRAARCDRECSRFVGPHAGSRPLTNRKGTTCRISPSSAGRFPGMTSSRGASCGAPSRSSAPHSSPRAAASAKANNGRGARHGQASRSRGQDCRPGLASRLPRISGAERLLDSICRRVRRRASHHEGRLAVCPTFRGTRLWSGYPSTPGVNSVWRGPSEFSYYAAIPMSTWLHALEKGKKTRHA